MAKQERIFWFRSLDELTKAAQDAFSTIHPNTSFCFGKNNLLYFTTYNSLRFDRDAVVHLERNGGIEIEVDKELVLGKVIKVIPTLGSVVDILLQTKNLLISFQKSISS